MSRKHIIEDRAGQGRASVLDAESTARIVRSSLVPMGNGLACLFLVFTAANGLLLEPPARWPMAGLALLSALVLFRIVRWLRDNLNAVDPHLVASTGFAIALANSVVRLWLTGDPAATANFGLIAMGVGLIYLDLRWALAAVGSVLAAWALALILGSIDGIASTHALGLLGTCAGSITVLAVRRRIYGHLERLRRQAIEDSEALSQNERRYQLTLEGSNDGLYTCDFATGEVDVSDRLAELLGDEGGEVRVQIDELADRIHPEDRDRARLKLTAHLKGDEAVFEDEFRIRGESGQYRWVLVRGASIRDDSGWVTRLAGSVTDMSRRGVFDPLTGLPNRRLFLDRLERVMERRPEAQNPEEGFAVLFMDLDGFKAINDTLGHQAGDDLLRLVANRLQSCLRACDTVARLGGDEFVVLIDEVKLPKGLGVALDRLTSTLRRPYDLDGKPVQIVPSIGVVVDTEEYDDPHALLGDADSAMYRAKESGESVVLFDSAMRSEVAARSGFELELREALDNEQFVLHFQSIISLADGTVEGYEALARWQHPREGLLSPARFVPAMEATGLIVRLGEWVIREACRRLATRFPDTAPQDMPYVSVNLSGKHLDRGGLIPMVEAALKETGLAAECLRIELTETTIISNPRRAAGLLGQLRLLGVQVLMDDFGTGHSSLGYLQDLPIDTLKIDRSFISRMTEDRDGAALVETIIRMARNLGLSVVAEGVETAEQASLLRGMCCGSGQGYLFARPAPLETFPDTQPALHG